MTKIQYEELIAFHPGYYLKRYIENQGITQEELAKRLQTTPKYVSDLVNARINLTDEMALKLSLVCDTSVTMWLNLNQKYIEKKLLIEKRIKLDEECKLAKMLDYKFWSDLGFVKATKNIAEKVEELQRYLKISSLSVLTERDFLVQYRSGVSKIEDIHVMNANAWVQTAINIGTQSEVSPFNKNKLTHAIDEIRSMTVIDPEVFYPRLVELLAECGVALVLLPNLKNSGVNGAVKWLSKDKVVLALNNRRKYADVFWFALFHELGHVLQQRIKLLHVSDPNITNSDENELILKLEKDADDFAQNTLIPKSKYDAFINNNFKKFDKNTVLEFAKEIHLMPGIVVGRLQKDGYLSYQSALNKCKVQYEIGK